jgi:prepilin-type N-terminal cleavage/methylation domain-containing protein
MQIKPRQKQGGFTLLEVIVALTITGFVLGGLFTLAGGSKQLAWKSVQSLESAAAARARINFALLEDDYGSIEPILVPNAYQIRSVDLINPPLRKTQPSIYSLQTYEVINDQTDEIIQGSRWVRFNLPR